MPSKHSSRDYESASGWEWHRIQQKVLADNERDNDGACQAQLSGCLGVATEVHHVVARIDGGGHNDQLAALCSACHYRYTVETIQQRAKERREEKRRKKRKNHPGRKDRSAPED